HGSPIVRIDDLARSVSGWELDVHALVQQRCGDHENDQQHKGQIQERRDIDLTQGYQRTALGKTAHDQWSVGNPVRFTFIAPLNTRSPSSRRVPAQNCRVRPSGLAGYAPASCNRTSKGLPRASPPPS